MNHLRLDRGRTTRCARRTFGLRTDQAEAFGEIVRETLRAVAHVDDRALEHVDRGRIACVEQHHRYGRAGVEFLLAFFAQQIAHRHRHVAEVNVHRARVYALVTHGAVIGHVREFIPMPERNAAPRLLFVQESFDQQAGRENLVARRVKQVCARHVRRAHRLAFAATQTVFHRIADRSDVACFKDQRLATEQAERRRVRISQVTTGHQLALVEAAFGIDPLLVALERPDLIIGQVFKFGEANAVLTGDHAVE